MTVLRLPRGAKIKTFPLPPAGFNPLTADAAMLRRFGLPQRPAGPPALIARWEKAVGRPRRFIEPTFRRVEGMRHRPRLRRLREGADTSDNWSGAVVFAPGGSTFTLVSAHWSVPIPNPASPDATPFASSCWIGIDGDGSNDVFQAGAECDAVNLGIAVARTISLWWEWFPDSAVEITNLPASAGDQLSCSLSVTSSTTGMVSFSNQTTGTATNFEVTAPAGTTLTGNSAEWIVERPEINGAISKLANYGEVDFTNCFAVTSAASQVLPPSGNTIAMNEDGFIVSK